MSLPNKSTWDLVPPRRPLLGLDFNGAQISDDAANPPDTATMPSAALFNTISALIVALARVTASAVVSVGAGASPSILQVASAASAVTAATFTLTRNSVGNYSLTWPANTFPSSISSPAAAINGPTAAMAGSQAIANGVQVFTFNSAGSAADFNFTVWIP